MVYASILENRAVIALAGAEAHDFLQGLITNDIEACREGRAIYAALLTPQGKILFDFFVVPHGENRWLIDCAGSRASDLIKRLTLYRLRAKVDIASRPDLAAAALWNGGGTIATQGFRLRVPYGSLLCVSDKPLHGEIKLPGAANAFYETAVAQHLEIGLAALDNLRARRDTLHSRKLRSFDEPPFR